MGRIDEFYLKIPLFMANLIPLCYNVRMKKKFFLPVLMSACLALSACGLTDSNENDASSNAASKIDTSAQGKTESNSGTANLPVIVIDDSTAPEEGMVRSKLTNEWIDADVDNTRPIAVIIPNELNAIPQYNISEASILYEANVEGRMTRLMGIFEDWEGLEKIGNVRSLRTYYAYWAFEWDAILVHVGGPFFIDELMSEETSEHIDESNSTDSDAFYRSSDRSAPHNAFVTGRGILNVIEKKGYSLTDRGLMDEYHYRFTSKAEPNSLAQYGDDAKSATYIDLSGCYPLTRCYFEYDESDGLYYRSQHLAGGTDGPHVDGATGEQLSFKNILVQYVTYEVMDGDDGYLTFQCHDTTQDGWYFTNGRGIHVNWEKASDYGATRYYDDYGNEIIMNTGKTMICIVEEDDNFTFR